MLLVKHHFESRDVLFAFIPITVTIEFKHNFVFLLEAKPVRGTGSTTSHRQQNQSEAQAAPPVRGTDSTTSQRHSICLGGLPALSTAAPAFDSSSKDALPQRLPAHQHIIPEQQSSSQPAPNASKKASHLGCFPYFTIDYHTHRPSVTGTQLS